MNANVFILFIHFITKRKILIGKILTNCWKFVKFVNIFPIKILRRMVYYVVAIPSVAIPSNNHHLFTNCIFLPQHSQGDNCKMVNTYEDAHAVTVSYC